LNTKFIFKRFDLATQSWLDDVEPLGSTTEMQFVSQRYE
jgi:hypothetical protein